MPVAAAIGIGSAVSGITSLISGNTQANAAQSAAQLQAQEAANSLAFQKQEFGTEQANEAPFLQAGQGAVTQLSQMLPSLTAPYGGGAFVAPSAAQAAATPGEAFQLQQGSQAVQNSAAANGGLLSGGTLAAEQQYGQGLAQTDYNNVYNQAQQTYNTNYNVAQNNQANTFNRYAAMAGMGQTTAQQLGAQGQAAASNVGNIDMTAGAQQGNDLQNAAAATASGYVGAGNSLNSGVNNISQYMLLSQLLGQQGGGGGAVGYF